MSPLLAPVLGDAKGGVLYSVNPTHAGGPSPKDRPLSIPRSGNVGGVNIRAVASNGLPITMSDNPILGRRMPGRSPVLGSGTSNLVTAARRPITSIDRDAAVKRHRVFTPGASSILKVRKSAFEPTLTREIDTDGTVVAPTSSGSSDVRYSRSIVKRIRELSGY